MTDAHWSKRSGRPAIKERVLCRTMLWAGGILVLASSLPLPVHADAPAPDQFARPQDRLERAHPVRITTSSGWLVAERVSPDLEGLAIRHVLTTSSGEALPIPNHIPWDDVIQVDRRSNHALAGGLVVGVVAGVVAGVSVYSAGQQGNDIGGGGIALLGVPVIAILGVVVGANMHSWRPVYRAPHSPPRQ